MRRRTRFLVIGALGLCLFAGTVRAGIGTFGVVDIIFPDPFDVIAIIDYLSRKDSCTIFTVKSGETVSAGKLLVARTRVDVVMDRSSRNWRGRVFVHLTVPSSISYSIDLSRIRPEHIRVDEKKRLVIVTMPALAVEDVTPILPELKMEQTFKAARCKLFDSDNSRDLQNSMLKEDYLGVARQTGETRIPEIREQGREALQSLLQRLLGAACPGIKVVVE